MPENAPNSFSKTKLNLKVVVFMGVLAGLVFGISGLGESHWQGGPLDDRESVEYVVDGDVQVSEQGNWSELNGQVLESGLSVRAGESSQLGLFIEDADLLRVYENGEVVFEDVDLSVTPALIKIKLISGAVWLSDLQGTVKWILDAGDIRVEPEEGSTYVKNDTDSVYVLAAHHPTKISFLKDGEVLNGYHLTESYQLTVKKTEINPTLAQLLYSKLIKDVPFSYLDEDAWESFVTSALKEDKKRLSKVYSEFLGDLRRNGDAGYEDGSFMKKIQDFYKSVRFYLTFSDQHLSGLEENEDVDILLQALYLMQKGEESLSTDRLNEFAVKAESFETLDKLNDFDRIFRSVYYGDLFYDAKVLVRDIQYKHTPQKERLVLSMEFLRERLNEVYDLLDKGDRAEAKQALLVYNQSWKDLLAEIDSDAADIVAGLTSEWQILQDLLYREDTFYDMDSYEVLSEMENKILTLTASEGGLNEARQTFIQYKLFSLKHLVELIDSELVGVNEGLDLGYLLISQSRVLLNDVTVETAIKSYFSDQLEEFSLMFEFIASSDFKLNKTGTFEEKFHSYLEKEDEMESLADYIRGLVPEENTENLTLEEAQNEVEDSLSRARVDYIAVVSLGDLNYRLFKIEGGKVNGVEFKANYDRLTQIVYGLQVGEEVFPSGVNLANLAGAITEATTEITDELTSADTSEGENGLTSLEKIIIDYAVAMLSAEGIEITDDQIAIIDLDKNLFKINYDFDNEGVIASVGFYFDTENVEASDVKAVYKEQIIEDKGPMAVSELESFILGNIEVDSAEIVDEEI